MISAYPLQWPDGWRRTPPGKRSYHSQFKTTFDRARQDLNDELRRLGAKGVVISSHLWLRRDGQPYADQARRKLEDPGVAVYFTLRGRQMVMARDAYENVHDNLRSIGLAIAHLRGLDRHGGATMMERAFDGFAALPDQAHWRKILGFDSREHLTLRQVEDRYREGAKRCHSDTGGGHEQMVKLNAAIAQARTELS